MKKLFAIMAVAAFALSAQAQGQRPRMNPEEMMQRRTEQMVKEYGLNAEQQQKLTELNKKYADKMMPRMGGQRRQGQGGPGGQPQGGQQGQRPERVDGATGATPQQGGQMRPQGNQMRPQGGVATNEQAAARIEYNNKLKEILTTEQYVAYQRDRIRPADIASRLDLNKKQAKKVAKLNKKYADKLAQEPAAPQGGQPQGGPQMGGQRQDGNGPQGQQMGQGRPQGQMGQGGPRMSEEQRKEFEANRKAYDEELKGILTTEQYEKYQKNEQERRQRGPRGGQGGPQGAPRN